MWTARKRTVYEYIVDRINQTETIRVCMNFCRAQTKTIGWSQEKLIYAIAENLLEGKSFIEKGKRRLFERTCKNSQRLMPEHQKTICTTFPLASFFRLFFLHLLSLFAYLFLVFRSRHHLVKFHLFEVFATKSLFFWFVRLYQNPNGNLFKTLPVCKQTSVKRRRVEKRCFVFLCLSKVKWWNE